MHYCYTRNGQPLGLEQPIPGKTAEGKVLARVLRPEEKAVTLSLPDGAVLTVPAEHVSEAKGVSPDVPVKS